MSVTAKTRSSGKDPGDDFSNASAPRSLISLAQHFVNDGLPVNGIMAGVLLVLSALLCDLCVKSLSSSFSALKYRWRMNPALTDGQLTLQKILREFAESGKKS